MMTFTRVTTECESDKSLLMIGNTATDIKQVKTTSLLLRRRN